MQDVGHVISSFCLNKQGLGKVKTAFWNLDAAALYEHAIAGHEGQIAKGGAFVTLTGKHTGRSPNDRFVVEDDATRHEVSWGAVNRPFSEENYQRLYNKMIDYFAGRDVFVQDCCAGTDGQYRLNIRVITERAMHSMFARNMFIQPDDGQLASFEPEFTVLQAPGLTADPQTDGTNSGAFIVVNFTQRIILVGGTAYAGEIKKSIFSVMNFLLPARDVLPMHCSANTTDDDNAAIFFGLSGTGKTTISADQSRILIGDDEHGWGPNGVFNFEGGCYAKTIALTAEAEPEIFETTRTFGSLIENVMCHDETRELDFFDTTYSENGRVSYDISKIPNASESGHGAHPKNIIMLTCDAFGVLPPISQLSPDQAMYHFLSGYTAKVAGTERGLKETVATFSTCFGAPFMPRAPSVYATLLGQKMAAHDARCWLVNTGWSAGGYGVGQRMKIAYTRAMVNAALGGKLDDVDYVIDPNFGVRVPQSCPGVPDNVLNPRATWTDQDDYDRQAQKVVAMFEENFKQFEDQVTDSVRAVAIRA